MRMVSASVLSILLVAASVSFGAQAASDQLQAQQTVSVQLQELKAEPSPATKDVILLLRDLLLQNQRLDAAQRKSIEAVKPEGTALSSLARKFERQHFARLYNAVDMDTLSTVVKPGAPAGSMLVSESGTHYEVINMNTLSTILRAYSSRRALGSTITIDVTNPAERHAALLALQWVEDAPRINPTAEPGYPWCLFLGGC